MHTGVDWKNGHITYSFGDQSIVQTMVSKESTEEMLLLSSRAGDFYTLAVDNCNNLPPSKLWTTNITGGKCYIQTNVICDPLLLLEYVRLLGTYGISVMQVYCNYGLSFSGYINDVILAHFVLEDLDTTISLVKAANGSLGATIDTAYGIIYQPMHHEDSVVAEEIYNKNHIGMQARFWVKEEAIDQLSPEFLDQFYCIPSQDGFRLELPYIILCPAIYVGLMRFFRERQFLIRSRIDDFVSSMQYKKDRLKMLKSRVSRIREKRKAEKEKREKKKKSKPD